MIYLERTVVIENSTAYIEEPIYLYKGDKNIEVRFSIQNNPFKYKNTLAYNYGQLIIKRDTAPNIFSEITKLSGGRIILTITGEMIDELSELGSYTFQIRLYNEDQTSRGTLPPVENGIVIVEPLCEEPLEPPKVDINPNFYEIRTNGGTNYNYLFCNTTLEQIPDLSTWDTSKVTNMANMFYYCEAITLDLNNWATSNVTNMDHMFYSCKFETLDLSNWDVSNVTTMDNMFGSCKSLTTLDLNSWNTSNVTNMGGMFYSCEKLETLDLSNFDMSNVTSTGWMFYSCHSLHTLRLDNCNNDTINKIITSSSFSKGAIEGVTRTIYCKEENAAGLTAPNNWIFEYIK